MRHGHSVLPICIGKIRGGERLGNSQALTVCFERCIELALRHQHVADLVVSDRQFALIGRVVRLFGCESPTAVRFSGTRCNRLPVSPRIS